MSSITIKELARELNLSAATVSRALSDSYEISAQPNKRFGHLPKSSIMSLLASALRSQKSKTLAVIVSKISKEP